MIGEYYLRGEPGTSANGAALPPSTAQPAPAAPAQSAADPALDAWNAAKDTDSSSVLEAFIGRFGGSFYGELAKAKLEELKKVEDAKRVAVAIPPPPVAPAPGFAETIYVAFDPASHKCTMMRSPPLGSLKLIGTYKSQSEAKTSMTKMKVCKR